MALSECVTETEQVFQPHFLKRLWTQKKNPKHSQIIRSNCRKSKQNILDAATEETSWNASAPLQPAPAEIQSLSISGRPLLYLKSLHSGQARTI